MTESTPGKRRPWSVPDDLLARIAARAPGYDADNAFLAEDLDELRQAGYLRIGVPIRDGGSGLGLRETAAVQRTLATAAPATALGLGMHQVWVQAARSVSARGGAFLQTVTDAAAADRLLAFGVSEPGNDAVLFDSLTTAEPDGVGGYRFTGTKVSTSLAPAWDLLSVFGKDTSGPEPRLVHGFAVRERRRGAPPGRLGHPRHAGDAEPDDDPGRAARAGGADRPCAAGRPGGGPARVRDLRGLRAARGVGVRGDRRRGR